MEAEVLTRALRVDSVRAASVFTDPKRRRILVQFLGRERSLGEAAADLGMKLNLLSYHVAALVRLGLLKIVRKQERAGRPIRFYRTVADAFLIPAAAIRRTVGEALALELRSALDRAGLVAGESDMLLFADSDGKPRISRHGGEAGSEASEYWRLLSLNRREAGQLGEALKALLRGYEDRAAPRARKGAATYLVHVAVAPRPGN